ncbi:MAG TPA: nucleoside monophosphate kinase [Acidobacteriaceae bacterium]|jgi:adenylate kinase|nr:nucleoside monophosphate kinase [Acidobacteriaceae bacterium]
MPETTPDKTGFRPGPVLMLGAPGAGKGTQAQALMAVWNIPQISTGDILRGVRNDPAMARTALGMLTRSLMEAGKLIPDERVNELVALRLTEPDTAKGFILDGFPRTLGQAEWLDQHLVVTPAPGGRKQLPVIAVSVKVGYNQLLRRITGRRNCPVCKSIYNVYTNPPKLEGVCDREGAILEQRADDTEAIFQERMRTYEAQTAPVVDHYRALGRFEEIDGELAVEEITARILAALARLRAAESVKGQ